MNVRDLDEEKKRVKRHEMANRSRRPLSELAGQARQQWIDEFVASDRLADYPAPSTLAIDENFGASYCGNHEIDLQREVERAYQLLPAEGLPHARWLAAELLMSLDQNLQAPLIRAPAHRLSVALILAHLEVLGHEFDQTLSASIARRAALILWNDASPLLEAVLDRKTMKPIVSRSGRVAVTREQLAGRDQEGPASEPPPDRASAEDDRPKERKRTADDTVEWLRTTKPIGLTGDLSIPVGTKLSMLRPTEFEQKEIARTFERDRQWQKANARHWVVVAFEGKRRLVPGTSVERLAVAD